VARESGLPQGSLLSPLLNNIALLPVNHWLREHVPAVVRYSDDMLLFAVSQTETDRHIRELEAQLAPQGLWPQDGKTEISPASQGVVFLGERVRSGMNDPPAGVPTSANPPRTLYITRPGVMLRKNGQQLEVFDHGQALLSEPSRRLGSVVAMGNCAGSADALRLTSYRSIPMMWMTASGKYVGHIETGAGADPAIEQRQRAVSMDAATRLRVAARIVEAKLRNSAKALETFAAPGEPGARRAILRLGHLARRCGIAREIGALNGIEGAGAAVYFRAYSELLPEGFRFSRRSRHPPLDPGNSLLSFVYTLLHFESCAALLSAGLNVHAGFLHTPLPGFAALAADCMEEFRAPVADTFVRSFINNEGLEAAGFRRDTEGCWMAPEVRRALLRAWAAHLWKPVGSRTWRDCLTAQARGLAEYLRGRTADYRPFLWTGLTREAEPCSSPSAMT
jgi:CRISPR-associated protein Cas1